MKSLPLSTPASIALACVFIGIVPGMHPVAQTGLAAIGLGNLITSSAKGIALYEEIQRASESEIPDSNDVVSDVEGQAPSQNALGTETSNSNGLALGKKTQTQSPNTKKSKLEMLKSFLEGLNRWGIPPSLSAVGSPMLFLARVLQGERGLKLIPPAITSSAFCLKGASGVVQALAADAVEKASLGKNSKQNDEQPEDAEGVTSKVESAQTSLATKIKEWIAANATKIKKWTAAKNTFLLTYCTIGAAVLTEALAYSLMKNWQTQAAAASLGISTVLLSLSTEQLRQKSKRRLTWTMGSQLLYLASAGSRYLMKKTLSKMPVLNALTYIVPLIPMLPLWNSKGKHFTPDTRPSVAPTIPEEEIFT